MAQEKRVVHKPVTQEAKNDMPKAPHVFLRGNVFYVRKRVPTELVPVLNACEIKVSLKTSDRKKAIAAATYAIVQLAARFDEARKSLVPKEAVRPTPVKELAEGDIHRIVASYFIAEEKRHEAWWVTEGQKWPQEALEATWDNLTGDISYYKTVREKSGNGFGTPAFDASGMAKLCLEVAGIELPPDSPSFAKLGELLRRALVETTARQIDRLRPYDSDALRELIESKGMKACIPPRSNRVARRLTTRSFTRKGTGWRTSLRSSKGCGASPRATTKQMSPSWPLS